MIKFTIKGAVLVASFAVFVGGIIAMIFTGGRYGMEIGLIGLFGMLLTSKDESDVEKEQSRDGFKQNRAAQN